jgi:chemotaxis protein methyltransferase WspC
VKEKIARLLKEAMGLDVATVGRSALDHAVRSRMNLCGLRDAESYWGRLQTSQTELQELIEAVVVPETWFFRDREAFNALAKLVMEDWLPAHGGRVLRILSVPCSSGEEPYSIAMALLDAGLPAHGFKVDAIDISARALALGERAAYGRNSFRGKELDFRERYFHATKQGHELAATVRERVRFEPGNLLGTDFMADAGGYDAIFCRNVLIYFDAPTQERVVKTLDRLLAADGILFVGPSEAFLIRGSGFVSANQPRAFAYRKASLTAPEVHEPRRKTKPASVKAVKPPPKLPAPPALKVVREPTTANKVAVDLELASRLADAGRLAEAAKACEAHLREYGASAAAWYLLGVVRDAMGEERAADCYRKVIYLEPNHPEALMHLALLAEKTGDTAGARRFQLRAHRVEKALQA